MNTLYGFDFDRYITPISPDKPAGEDARYSSIFRDIQEAGRADDPDLPVGVWGTVLKKSDWPRVEALCAEALLTTSKDVRLVAWLAEAWIAQHGYSALEPSLKLYHLLLENFWDNFYPTLDGDDSDVRLAAFEKGIDKLVGALISAPLIRGRDNFVCSVDVWRQCEYETRLREHVRDTPRDRIGMNVTELIEAMGILSRDHLVSRDHELEAAYAMLQSLVACCRTKPFQEPPGWYRVRHCLEEAQKILRHLERSIVDAPEVLPGEDTEDPFSKYQEEEEAQSGPKVHRTSPHGGEVLGRSRSELFDQLTKIASELQKLEPHSPAPFLIRRAIEWGNMELPQLFDDLFQEGQDVQSVRRLLGF